MDRIVEIKNGIKIWAYLHALLSFLQLAKVRHGYYIPGTFVCGCWGIYCVLSFML